MGLRLEIWKNSTRATDALLMRQAGSCGLSLTQNKFLVESPEAYARNRVAIQNEIPKRVKAYGRERR